MAQVDRGRSRPVLQADFHEIVEVITLNLPETPPDGRYPAPSTRRIQLTRFGSLCCNPARHEKSARHRRYGWTGLPWLGRVTTASRPATPNRSEGDARSVSRTETIFPFGIGCAGHASVRTHGNQLLFDRQRVAVLRRIFKLRLRVSRHLRGARFNDHCGASQPGSNQHVERAGRPSGSSGRLRAGTTVPVLLSAGRDQDHPESCRRRTLGDPTAVPPERGSA